jgi:hypothetical protein
MVCHKDNFYLMRYQLCEFQNRFYIVCIKACLEVTLMSEKHSLKFKFFVFLESKFRLETNKKLLQKIE